MEKDRSGLKSRGPEVADMDWLQQLFKILAAKLDSMTGDFYRATWEF